MSSSHLFISPPSPLPAPLPRPARAAAPPCLHRPFARVLARRLPRPRVVRAEHAHALPALDPGPEPCRLHELQVLRRSPHLRPRPAQTGLEVGAVHPSLDMSRHPGHVFVALVEAG